MAGERSEAAASASPVESGNAYPAGLCPTSTYIADEAWPDLETYFEEESLAIVPVGSTEQHGPHLLEGTDHIIEREGVGV